jgi:hypothetical protein
MQDAYNRIINLGYGSKYFITKCGAFPIYKCDVTDTGTNVSIRDESIAIYDGDIVHIYKCDRKEAHAVSAIITWVLFPEEAYRML